LTDHPHSEVCRRFPSQVLHSPGLLTLPPGCDAALADAGLTVSTHEPLTQADVDGDLGKLYDHACWLPPADQDLDGIGDSCDLCTFAFDPENQPYVDENGKLWPDAGRYCYGDYSIDAVCGD
jgi:hypothetical protein